MRSVKLWVFSSSRNLWSYSWQFHNQYLSGYFLTLKDSNKSSSIWWATLSNSPILVMYQSPCILTKAQRYSSALSKIQESVSPRRVSENFFNSSAVSQKLRTVTKGAWVWDSQYLRWSYKSWEERYQWLRMWAKVLPSLSAYLLRIMKSRFVKNRKFLSEP